MSLIFQMNRTGNPRLRTEERSGYEDAKLPLAVDGESNVWLFPIAWRVHGNQVIQIFFLHYQHSGNCRSYNWSSRGSICIFSSKVCFCWNLDYKQNYNNKKASLIPTPTLVHFLVLLLSIINFFCIHVILLSTLFVNFVFMKILIDLSISVIFYVLLLG